MAARRGWLGIWRVRFRRLAGRVTLACGSLGEAGALGNAASVFAGVDIVVAQYDDAVARWARGEDPMDAPFPMHPSFEARRGVPDRAFPWVSPAQGERMAVAWAALFAQSEAMAERGCCTCIT